MMARMSVPPRFHDGVGDGAQGKTVTSAVRVLQLAAIASVAGREDLQDCKPARPLSVLEMHGTDDASVPYTGGASAVQRWVTLDGCTGNPTQSTSGITTTSIWSNCQRGTVVRFDTIEGGHHQWFGSTFDPVPGEPNSNPIVWDFFSKSAPRL